MTATPALSYPHFPVRFQAVIWRNWGLVPLAKLAQVLRTTSEQISRSAEELGLAVTEVQSAWLERGYITLIRGNWHLLSWEQLVELLGWERERLDQCLKEDDFLWHKLGYFKPDCDPVAWRPLTESEKQQTCKIADWMRRHFPEQNIQELPFAFVNQLPVYPGDKPQHVDFDLRLAYSYSALYGDPLLDSPETLYPEHELKALKSWGVNAVWLQVILYQLSPWTYLPDLSEGWQIRLNHLRELVKRAQEQGIEVYLYLNEPRCLSDHYFEQLPVGFRGVSYPKDGYSNLCTSEFPVREFIRKATEHVYREVPGLGGCFTITLSENPTHCHSHRRGEECLRCAQRDPAEVVAEVNALIEEGVHAANPRARVLVYTWAWQFYEWGSRIVDLLPKQVELMCVSEINKPIEVGGVPTKVKEYSISQPGPGEWALMMWSRARARGMKTIAKIQINNSWECGAVPYIPVADLVEEHLNHLREVGVDGLMLSWTLGGYPGGNLGLLGATPDEWAVQLAGEPAGASLRKSWRLFSEAFREFPYSQTLLYRGPIHQGPANLLYASKTGFQSTMVCFAYDDYEAWGGEYPVEILEQQFHLLSGKWQQGLTELRSLCERVATGTHEKRLRDQLYVAEALYCIYHSTALQIRWNRLREKRDPQSIHTLTSLLDEEILLAKKLYQLVSQDSRIGYEPSNHYFFTANDLREKVINCEFLKAYYFQNACL